MSSETNNDALIHSSDPEHPANLICELCRKFYTLGWVGLHTEPNTHELCCC